MAYYCPDRICGAIDCDNCHPGGAAAIAEEDARESWLAEHGLKTAFTGLARGRWIAWTDDRDDDLACALGKDEETALRAWANQNGVEAWDE